MNYYSTKTYGHNIGLRLVDNLGYDNTWFIMIGLGFAGILLLLYLKRMLISEHNLN